MKIRAHISEIIFLLFCFLFFPISVYASSISVTGSAKASLTNYYLDFTGTSTVTIDSTSGNFSGYAWSEDVGWLAFGTTDNDQGPVKLNLSTGAVTGKAKALDTGYYLDFGGTSNVTVSIPAGVFSGYAWSEDVGWIDFSDTGVHTTTPFSQPTPTPSSGSSGSSSSGSSPPVCSDPTPGAKAPWLYGAIAQDGGNILLYFTQADTPVDKYVLEYGTSSGNYQFGIQNMGINERGQMTYTVSSLAPDTTYYFRVRAGNGCATGAWSNEISTTTKGIIATNQLQITSSVLVPNQNDSEQTNNPSNKNSCQTYTVKSGDSLWNIARKLLGDGNNYKDIIEQNKNTYSSLATSNSLTVGWKLEIGCPSSSKIISKNKKETQTNNIVPTSIPTPTQGGYDVNVKVLDDNKKPVEGATVTLHSIPQTTKTDKNGIAAFHHVEQGDHKVLIAHDGYKGEQAINLTGNVKAFDLNVTVKPQNVILSPLAIGIISVMAIIILVLGILLIRTWKMVKKINKSENEEKEKRYFKHFKHSRIHQVYR